jgi:hypothetical protein
MNVIQIVAAAFGFAVIGVTLWKLIRNGVAPSNGKAESFDPVAGQNTEWMGDGH